MAAIPKADVMVGRFWTLIMFASKDFSKKDRLCQA